MSDKMNSPYTNVNITSAVNNNGNDVCEKLAEQKTNDISAWSIVRFESDDEVEGFNDLIPSSWISNSLAWYPMNEHKGSIHKLVKQCAKVKSNWKCFSIKMIEKGIENYDRGMRMLIKVSKNPNASLHSDIEEKGKGKRLKKVSKKLIDSDKENSQKQNVQNEKKLPPFPKLMTTKKAASTIQQSCISQNIFQEVILEKDSSERKDNSLDMSKQFETHFENTEECKIPGNKKHKCAYNEKGEVTFKSLADAICYLSAELMSCQLTLRKTDRNLESFFEMTATAQKPQPETAKPFVSIMEHFPLLNIEDLNTVERKLKKDETFNLQVINALHLQVAGEPIKKQVTGILRMVLHDNLASGFNWKGQRGDKQKMSNRRITKTMIEVVAKDYPQINDKMFGRLAGSWLAQATFRLKKHADNNDVTTAGDDNTDNSTDKAESSDDLEQENV